MKRLLLLVFIIMLVGCNQETIESSNQISKSVRVVRVVQETHVDYETYVGHVVSAGLIKRAFEVSGKINRVEVAVGDTVKEGDLLLSVDTEGLNYALDAAKAEVSAAQAQYVKALESLNFVENSYKDTKKLFDEGVASKSALDQVSLNLDVSRSDVNAAREQVNRAKTNLEVQSYNLDHSDLYASKDGVVLDVLNEVGEIVSAGHPVVVLRDKNAHVSFGVAQEDLTYVSVGDNLDISCGDLEITGQVVKVSQVPDTSSQTYEVEVSLSKDLPLGSIVSIKLSTEDVLGSKIPLGAIRSDGEDYVYLVKDGYVERVTIEVVAIFNQEVVVRGLDRDVQIIVEGIMGVNPGDTVTIVGDE